MTFYERFELLCSEKGLRPQSEEIIKITGVSSPAISGWKKKGTLPRTDVISRIATYFNVTTDYLTGTSEVRTGFKNQETTFNLTAQEETLVKLFREATEEDRLEMINAFMNIKNRSSHPHVVYRAARSEGDTMPTEERRSASDINKLKNAATVTSDDEL